MLANSAGPVKTSQKAASDQDQHCFLLYFSMNYTDFSVKSELIISMFQTLKLSL